MPRPPPNSAVRPVGAHSPAAGGLAKASLRYAETVRAEAIQIFVTNPRAWAAAPVSIEESDALREHVASTGLPLFVHSPYLINVASPDVVVRERSASLLGHCVRRAAEIGARGVVVHAGSAVAGGRDEGLARARETLLPLLNALPDARYEGNEAPDLLIEPMAGQGRVLCAAIGDLGPYLTALDWHPRARVCLDTCHLFGAGHDLTAPGGVAAALGELAAVAPGRLALIHANDARDGCGSKRDRHENIGEGTLGRGPFWDLLHDPATAGVPFIVETPGGEDSQARECRSGGI